MSIAGSALRSVAIAAAASLVAVSPSFGFRMIQNTTTGTVSAGNLVTCDDSGGFTHWTNSSISWYHNTAGQGSGKQTAIQNALASWTNIANADHTLTYAGTTSAGWATDGQNTVLWANGNGCTGSCLALTALTLQSGQVIVETDVTFNSSYTWNTNGADYDTEAVAAHEFGHTLGIHHTEVATTPRPTMYASYFGTDGRTLHADDIAALECAQTRYGSPSSAPAVPTSFWVRPAQCYGLIILSWDAVTGATYYEVQQSWEPYFTFPLPVYSGTSTYIYHDNEYDHSNNHYRVRACDSSACSAYASTYAPSEFYDPCIW